MTTAAIERTPFRYPIRNRKIAKELEEIGFTVWHPSPEATTMEAPAGLTATQARRAISLMIRLYKAGKDYERSRERYESLVNALNSFNGQR